MNYLVLGNFIILASVFLIHKQELWIGMVLIAAVPPSLEIILLGNLLRIEKNYVFTVLAGTYLGALFIIPLVGLGFFKYINLELLEYYFNRLRINFSAACSFPARHGQRMG